MNKIFFSIVLILAVSLANAQWQDYHTLFKQEDKSSIEYIKHTESGMQGVKTDETTYKTFYASIIKEQSNYIARLRTQTIKYFSAEGQDRTIAGEIFSADDPRKIISKFSHKADAIYFDTNDYLTIQYGCCGAPNIPSVYDYRHRLIIDGQHAIAKTDVYLKNEVVNIYTSLKSSYENKDTLGVFTYAYSADDKYLIYLLANKPSSFCSDYWFEYTASLKNNAKVEKYARLEGVLVGYQFETLNNINKIEDSTGIVFNVQYQCMSYTKEPTNASLADKKYTIQIPIINGKPFGKPDKTQVVKVNVD